MRRGVGWCGRSSTSFKTSRPCQGRRGSFLAGDVALASARLTPRARQREDTGLTPVPRSRRIRDMAQGLILEFDGVGRDEYDAVNGNLGIDPDSGQGDWPAGLVFHAGGAKPGGWVVFE